MRILDKLIIEGWWKDKEKPEDLEISISKDELEYLKKGKEIIKQDQEGAFICISIPIGKFKSEDIQIDRLPIANDKVKK